MSRPCLACAPSLICPDPSDFAATDYYYATQDYLVVVNCPPGYNCRGWSTRTVVIPKEDVPPVPQPPGVTTLRLKGCRYDIVRTVSYPAPPQRQTGQTDDDYAAAVAAYQAVVDGIFADVAKEMQQEWAQQEAECIPPGSPGNPFPPATPRPPGGGGNCVMVGNDEQSYTANCPNVNCGSPVTKTVAANTYSELVCRANDIPVVKAQLNAQALASATALAEGSLNCSGGNIYMAQTGFCPENPHLYFRVEIPACTFYEGGDVNRANAKASASLSNQIQAGLAALGCPCPGFTVAAGGYGIINSPCPIWVAWDRNSPATFWLSGNFDPAAQFLAFNGSVLHGASTITPIFGNFPPIFQYYP